MPDRTALGQLMQHFWRQRATKELKHSRRNLVREVKASRAAVAAGTGKQADLDEAVWCLGLLEGVLAERHRRR